MELTNDFVIDRPIEEIWTVLNDLEFIAPCMPGAQLTEIEGEEYRGTVKIKVGPITAQYKGKARFIEQNHEAKTIKLKAEGRDPRQGNANAEVSAQMEAVTGESTKVVIQTDLKLSGKVASFGRGIIEDVSKNLLGTFVDNLRQKLETEGAPDSEAGVSASAAPAAAAGVAAAAGGAAAGTNGESAAGATDTKPATESTKRTIDSPAAEPVNLLAITGDPITKRLLPVVGGIVVLLILRRLFRGRGR